MALIDDIPLLEGLLPGAEGATWEDPGLWDAWEPGMDLPGFGDSIDVEGSLPEEGMAFDEPQPIEWDEGNPYLAILKKMGQGIVGNDQSSPRSDLFRGAGLEALGGFLQAKFGQPTFQQRRPFTGSADPQKLLEQGMGGLGELKGLLAARPQVDLSGIQAQNPMGGMADDEVMQVLKGIR